MENTLIITVYTTISMPFSDDFLNEINMVNIELPMKIVFDFFRSECLKDFRPDYNEGISDRGLFDEWLDEYTADDTQGLWEYAKEHGVDPKIDRIYEDM